MDTHTIIHDEEPIRLFRSDFMEFFTHITPLAVLLIWVPVVLILIIFSFIDLPIYRNAWHIPLGFFGGLAFWTFAEYMLHRFLFHFPAKGEKTKKVFFLFHGVHHAQPQCKTRLVMPPALSIPLAIVFYFLFNWILGGVFQAQQYVFPAFAGYMTGYLIYDMIHYATHHFAMRDGYWKFIKRYHMQHHYKTPNARYGVSSPLWDKVFNTLPE